VRVALPTDHQLDDDVPRHRVTVFVMALTVALLFASAAGYHLFSTSFGEPSRVLSMPWPLLALLFFVAEIRAVEVRLRGQTFILSFSALVATAGLFCVSGAGYLLATTIGTGASLVVSQRQRGVKLAFNLAKNLLTHMVVLGVFGAFNEVAVPGPRAWLSAIAGLLVAYALSACCIAVVVALTTGRLDVLRWVRVIGFIHLAALVMGNLGLIAVTLVVHNPSAVWLLVAPTVLICVAINAYGSQKGQRDRLELLYESSQILQSSPEAEAALRMLVIEARESFQARIAELTLFPEERGQPHLRLGARDDGPGDDRLRPVDEGALEAQFRTVVEQGQALLVRANEGEHHGLHTYLRGRGIREALIAPLLGEDRVVGAIMLADHLVAVSQFRDEDLQLFATLTRQASVSLQNAHIDHTLAELRQLGEELRYRTYHDALTGLPNRALFAEELEDAVAGGAPGSVALLHIDVDDFKYLNDTLGPAEADGILTEIGDRISARCRPGDVVARLGGDEFAVLLRGVDDEADADRLAERLLESFAEPVCRQGRSLRVRASIGLAGLEVDGTSDELLRNADVAMYRAKLAGKDQFKRYETGMWEELSERLNLIDELNDAVTRREFRVFYQPLVDLASGAVNGVEALVRWEHPQRGLLSPAEFLEAAAETDLIVDIDRQVLDTACREVAEWRRDLGRELALNVNVSASQLRNPALVSEVREALGKWRLDPRCLTLELTEQQVVEDVEAARGQLHALRDLGVRIAIDDFGTGYSSLSYLHRFPIDALKIPRPFIADIDQADHRVLARAIIHMGHALGLHVVAEGIETIAQRDMLRRWGCHTGQGFVFAKPVPAGKAKRMVADCQPLGGAWADSTDWMPRSNASTR
jgi:diguanylate cyclase (GGDEF)-like protein